MCFNSLLALELSSTYHWKRSLKGVAQIHDSHYNTFSNTLSLFLCSGSSKKCFLEYSFLNKIEDLQPAPLLKTDPTKRYSLIIHVFIYSYDCTES